MLPTREPRPSSSDTGLTPPAFSAHTGSSQAPGLGLGGSPESGLSSPLSALQLISSGSASHTWGKFNLPTISGTRLLNSSGVTTHQVSKFYFLLFVLFCFHSVVSANFCPGSMHGFPQETPSRPRSVPRNLFKKKKLKDESSLWL